MNGVVYSTRAHAAGDDRDHIIMEIWIEKIGICINESGDAFVSAAPRRALNHFGTFDIADAICTSIRDYVARKQAYEQINAKIFAALKRRLVDKKTQHNRVVR